jgi:hypothetical protein
MKRLALLILVLALMVPAGMAQDKQKKEKQKKDLPTPLLEVWGGMGLSTVSGNIAAAKNRLTGLFGVGFTLPLSKQNNLHFEGGYSFQGFNYKSGTYTVNDTAYNLEAADQRFNYFILAVQDKYFLDKKRTYYVNGGFYLAYLSHARFQANFDILEDGQVVEHVELDDGNKDDFSGVDFGLTGGIGVRLGNKALSNFTIEARMAYGIINIAKSVGENTDPKAHNIYGVLKLGIDIPVKP